MRFTFVLATTISMLYLGCREVKVPESLAKGQPAPDFRWTDVQGNKVHLEDLKGKVVLLDFWATWCGPCRAEIPTERRVFEKFQGQPFEFIAVSHDRDEEDLMDFLKGDPVPWKVVHDRTGVYSRPYRVEVLPTVFLIGKDGKIIRRWLGGGQFHKIETAIEEALSQP